MSQKSPLMVSVSGIRGIVGDSLTEDVVTKFAHAYARLINGSKIVIGRDTRSSGPSIEKMVVDVLVKHGYHVVLLGVCPTPTVGLAIHQHSADGGIVITASHNPGEWNALKLMNGDGEFLSVAEGEKLLEFYEEDAFFESSSRAGSVETYNDACSDHIEKLLIHLPVEKIKNAHLKIAYDSVNGAGSIVTQTFLEALGCEIFPIHNDPLKDFPRNPEPTKTNLKDTCEWVSKHDYDLCFVQDPDADRLAIIDGKGSYIGEEYTLALAMHYVLNHCERGQSVVANLSSTMLLDYIAKKHGAVMSRSAVGEAHVVAKMHETDAVIGGEGNGGVIYRETHLGRDSLIGMGLVLALMVETKQSISQLINLWPVYELHKEKISINKKDFDQIIKNCNSTFEDAQKTEIDGVKYIWPEGWLHVRASNTEPVVRIIIEATSKHLLDQLLTKVHAAFECV